MQTELEYITHHLTLTEIGSITKISVLVNEPITHDWFDIIFHSDFASRYVVGERILINNFLRSLLTLPILNTSEDIASIHINFFEDEGRYYVFCVQHDLPFNEQEWFKTAYIESNIILSTSIAINKSIQLVGRLFPETIEIPLNPIDRIFDQTDDKSVFRKNYYEVEKILKDNGIDRFYHSTATENIASIKEKNGLLSLERLRNQCIPVKFASSENSRSIDAKKGISDYVHLSFESYYPMMKKAVLCGQLANYSMLIISPIVAILKDTLFSEKNLVTTGVLPSNDIEVLYKIPFYRFHKKQYWELSQEDKNFYMAEVLVKGFIPSSSIINWDSL